MGRVGGGRVGTYGRNSLERCAPKVTAEREMAKVKIVFPRPSIACVRTQFMLHIGTEIQHNTHISEPVAVGCSAIYP